MRLRQADCTRLSLVVSDPYVDVFKRGDERRNKCECYGDSEGRYCSTVDVPFVTHDSSPSPASYRWSYLARPMLQKRKSQYGKHYRVSATISLTYLGSGITPTPTCPTLRPYCTVSTAAPEAEVVEPTAAPRRPMSAAGQEPTARSQNY
jgi:hypothetical protein